jgi:cell division septum initiation protein DivIVA
VRNTVLATAVAATLALAAPQAFAQAKGSATKAEVQAIEAQMKALAERLNKLEASNTQLQSENEQLKAVVDRREAEIDYLKSQTKELREEGAVASNEISKVKGADWATKLKGRGDFRFRHEMIESERVVSGQAEDAADRTRQRIRARLGFDYKVTDTVKGTLLFATGGDDPRSSNQTLGGTGTRKSIGVDMAYVDWQFMNGANLVLGKQQHPYFRPGQSLFFDGDWNPEGGAVKFDRGMFFGSAYGWWLTEQFNSNPAGENNDSNLFGAQVGMKFPLLGGETVLAAHYFDCGACQDNSPLYANNGNGNTTYTVGTSNTQLLRYDYEILQLSAQMGTTLLGQPFTFWADYAQNMASGVEYDTAYGVGVVMGKASNAKTWEAGVAYQSLDKDALFAQIIDSDFGDGRTDSEGWFLKGGYAPVKNVTLNATYFINTLNKDVGVELDYNRLQLDINYKF